MAKLAVAVAAHFTAIAGAAIAPGAAGNCGTRDHTLLQVAGGARTARVLEAEIAVPKKPCDEGCDCWGELAGDFTCGDRINFVSAHRGEHTVDGRVAAETVRNEFPDICSCPSTDLPPATSIPNPSLPAGSSCQDTCQCWTRFVGNYTCGARITWVAGPRGDHAVGHEVAAAVVRNEFPEICSCGAGEMSHPALGPQESSSQQLPKGWSCDDSCACWGSFAGNYTCGDRILWVAGPPGSEHSVDGNVASAIVRNEFPEICACTREDRPSLPVPPEASQPLERSQGPCEDTCDCWDALADNHTCGERILWVSRPRGEHTIDRKVSSFVVLDEFPEICRCGEARVPDTTALVPKNRPCEDGCQCWGMAADEHTCGYRILWAAGPQGPHSRDFDSAAALVHKEFPAVCECREGEGSSSAPEPTQQLPAGWPCNDRCSCWGSLAGNHTCGGRIRWVTGPPGSEHSVDRNVASAVVRNEFPEICACTDEDGPGLSKAPDVLPGFEPLPSDMQMS